MSYIDTIKEKARSDRKTIVMPETNDKRTLIAAAHVLQEGIANIIMVGNEEKIMDGAGWLEVDLTGVTVIDPNKTDKLDEYVEILYETRKAKGMTMEKAREILLSDPLTFGVVMVKANDADGMVAGACHATADVLRPSLQILRTAPGVKLVSAFFILDVPDCEYGEHGTFLFADCGLNQDPTSEELAAIADTSAKSFKQLIGVSGVGPKAALAILSVCTPQELAMAVITGDEKALIAAPGIGKKIAQRIILELKDKLTKEQQEIGMPTAPGIVAGEKSKAVEAAAALAVLGYTQQDIAVAMKGVDVENLPLEEIVRQSLKKMVK